MKLYSDTELDNDIKYVKEIFTRYGAVYKEIGKNFFKLNKTVSGRIEFILSQFKHLCYSNRVCI